MLATLERRQAERLEHLAAMQRLIDDKQREIDKVRAAGTPVRGLVLVKCSDSLK